MEGKNRITFDSYEKAYALLCVAELIYARYQPVDSSQYLKTELLCNHSMFVRAYILEVCFLGQYLVYQKRKDKNELTVRRHGFILFFLLYVLHFSYNILINLYLEYWTSGNMGGIFWFIIKMILIAKMIYELKKMKEYEALGKTED